MKNFYSIKKIDLRFHVDLITPKKIHLFEEFSGRPDKESLFVILIRHRQIEIISHVNKIIEVKLL